MAFCLDDLTCGKYRIVVGQEWEYREDMALGLLPGN